MAIDVDRGTNPPPTLDPTPWPWKVTRVTVVKTGGLDQVHVTFELMIDIHTPLYMSFTCKDGVAWCVENLKIYPEVVCPT